MKCRFCDNKLDNSVINLGLAPPSNAYLKDLRGFVHCYLDILPHH